MACGDGTQIKIWDDIWIPNSQHGRILTPRGNVMLSMVSELINPITRLWGEAIVRDNFWAIDASRILAVSLSQNDMEDFFAWRFTNNCLFVVRLAYHVERNHNFVLK